MLAPSLSTFFAFSCFIKIELGPPLHSYCEGCNAHSGPVRIVSRPGTSYMALTVMQRPASAKLELPDHRPPTRSCYPALTTVAAAAICITHTKRTHTRLSEKRTQGRTGQ